MNLTEKDIRIDRYFDTGENEHSWVFYIETWFDVDSYFGTDTADDDDTWINFYAIYDENSETWHFMYVISSSEKCDEHDWTSEIPDDDRRLIVDSICQMLWSTFKYEECITDCYGSGQFEDDFFIFRKGDSFTRFCEWIDKNCSGGYDSLQHEKSGMNRYYR